MVSAGRPDVLNDRYQIGDLIGRGGMGDVYRGVDLRLQRVVAVKFLRPDLAAQPAVRERFEEEARSAARITHPNVVLVLDSGEHDEHPYLVMECLPGHTLHDEIAQGALDSARVRSIALDVLAGLGAAHDMGIVHRDIKPSNVLISDDGVAKIADFGIAKSTDGIDLTLTGQVFGTPSYLAPERLSGEPATPSADVYAVGVVLYEALTGTRPFQGDSPVSVAHAIAVTVPPPLADVVPAVDPRLRDAIETAMEKDPACRFPSAAAMRQSLDNPPPAATIAAPADAGATRMIEAPTRAMQANDVGRVEAAPERARRAQPPWMTMLRERWILVAAAILILAFVLAATTRHDKNDQSATTGTTQPTTAVTAGPTTAAPAVGTLPKPLADAIDRLEKAVGK